MVAPINVEENEFHTEVVASRVARFTIAHDPARIGSKGNWTPRRHANGYDALMSATETIPFVYTPEDTKVNDARILRAVRTLGVEGTAVFSRTADGWARVVVTISGEPEPMRIARNGLPMEAQDLGFDRDRGIKSRPNT
jgi:hypothetical protein